MPSLSHVGSMQSFHTNAAMHMNPIVGAPWCQKVALKVVKPLVTSDRMTHQTKLSYLSRTLAAGTSIKLNK